MTDACTALDRLAALARRQPVGIVTACSLLDDHIVLLGWAKSGRLGCIVRPLNEEERDRRDRGELVPMPATSVDAVSWDVHVARAGPFGDGPS